MQENVNIRLASQCIWNNREKVTHSSDLKQQNRLQFDENEYLRENGRLEKQDFQNSKSNNTDNMFSCIYRNKFMYALCIVYIIT